MYRNPEAIPSTVVEPLPSETREFTSVGCCRNIETRSFMTAGGKDIQQKFQIPLRLSKLPIIHPFARYAYELDYDRPNILNLGAIPTKWCQELSFSIAYCFLCVLLDCREI